MRRKDQGQERGALSCEGRSNTHWAERFRPWCWLAGDPNDLATMQAKPNGIVRIAVWAGHSRVLIGSRQTSDRNACGRSSKLPELSVYMSGESIVYCCPKWFSGPNFLSARATLIAPSAGGSCPASHARSSPGNAPSHFESWELSHCELKKHIHRTSLTFGNSATSKIEKKGQPTPASSIPRIEWNCASIGPS
jgi:hypothetical protein